MMAFKEPACWAMPKVSANPSYAPASRFRDLFPEIVHNDNRAFVAKS